MARVLLVEDNEVNRIGLSRRLERRGYQVSMAVDGQQGLEKARAEVPDLILLDMNLPLLDGWEVARRLKAEQQTSNIRIIALTAHALSGDREKCIQAGCDDYHTKPVDLTRLLMQIEVILRQSPPAGPSAGGPVAADR